ncbi:hypothetical protein V1264_008418 [Littorina saxatilis]|uniref:Uncharacterized protein n=1 Tax=Littorina saxatilis TaxID=31220 RepID=A0AAN9ASZ1_9CAEN
MPRKGSRSKQGAACRKNAEEKNMKTEEDKLLQFCTQIQLNEGAPAEPWEWGDFLIEDCPGPMCAELTVDRDSSGTDDFKD